MGERRKLVRLGVSVDGFTDGRFFLRSRYLIGWYLTDRPFLLIVAFGGELS